jgi:N-acyl-L-homoserine lactone synthetase
MDSPMRVISGRSGGLPADVYWRMARYRHQVFVERLGWLLDTQDGAEIDQFDRADTVYVAVEDREGNIAGCARLLPTVEPYMLGDAFPRLFNGMSPPRDPSVWELSRFASMDFTRRTDSPLANFSSPTTAVLMREVMACAAHHGAKRLVTVSPLGLERLIRRLGLCAHRAGPPTLVNGQAVFACWIEI